MAIRGIETGPNALREALEGCVEATTKATPTTVFEVLADLRTHLDWGGERKSRTMRLVTLDAPAGPATAGTEFATTGSDPNGMFADRSVVIEATPGRVFEFVTEAVLSPKKGGATVDWTIVHRYEIALAADGGSHVSYRYRITRISRLIGPLRLLKTPLAPVLMKMWAAISRKGLRNLVAVADALSADAARK